MLLLKAILNLIARSVCHHVHAFIRDPLSRRPASYRVAWEGNMEETNDGLQIILSRVLYGASITIYAFPQQEKKRQGEGEGCECY